MPRLKHTFVIGVASEELYLSPRELLLDYGYEEDLNLVPEIKVPRGRYEVVMEVLKTTRGKLIASGIFEVRTTLVVGDLTHVIPESRWPTFDRDQKNHIMRGMIRNCASIYTGKEGEFKVSISLTKVVDSP